ncbi:MAG: type II secretion system F family protein [Magnetococcales bacterium]|nr:type II secretion system F family protein [Magnetococcales bacterium]
MMFGVSRSELFLFMKQMAVLSERGVSLNIVLRQLQRDIHNRSLKKALLQVAEEVERGVEFPDALSAHPRIFDQVVVSVIRAGFSSGDLAVALRQASDYLRRMDEIGREVRGALYYPGFILVFVAISMLLFFIKGFPWIYIKIVELKVKITPELQSLKEISDWVLSVDLTLIVSVLGGMALLGAILAVTPYRRFGLAVVPYIPLVGKIIRFSALERLSRTWMVQVSNGVQILPALTAAFRASGSILVTMVEVELLSSIRRGEGLADAFAEYPIFDGVFQQLIRTGEESGDLGGALASLADYLGAQVQYRMKLATSVLPLLVMLVVFAAVGYLLVTILIPLTEFDPFPASDPLNKL